MVLGFVVAMSAIWGGVYLIAHGAQPQGLTSIIAALVGLVGVFIYARKEKVKELSRKWNRMLSPTPDAPSESTLKPRAGSPTAEPK